MKLAMMIYDIRFLIKCCRFKELKMITKALFFFAVWLHTYTIQDVFGQNNPRFDLSDSKNETNLQTFDYKNAPDEIPKDKVADAHNMRYDGSGSVQTNNKDSMNDGHWKILYDDQICFPSNDGRPRCLKKSKRRKVQSIINSTSMTNALNGDLDKNDDIHASSSTLNFNSNNQFSDDLKSFEVMPENIEKWSATLESGSCACYWSPDKCGCDCKGSLNYDDFQDLAINFFPCLHFTFTMADGQHYALPPNFFSKVQNVEEFNLFITDTIFEYICDPTPMTSPFKGVTFANSAQIKLTNVNVRRGWNWQPFEHLKSTSGAEVNITLEDCPLRRLTSDFANLAGGHVNTIDIHNSDLEMVGSNAFGTFENMAHFRVPSNKIRQLRRTDFPHMLPNLEELDFRNNEISKLDDDQFTNMPSLKEIFLSGNPITVLPEATFQVVMSQAKLIGISDIPLTCDCRLKWLKDSMMHDNNVKKNMKGAVCRRPSYLRGTPLTHLAKEHLRCF